MKNSKQFVEEGMHPQVVIKGYQQALKFILGQFQELSVGTGEAGGQLKMPSNDATERPELKTHLRTQGFLRSDDCQGCKILGQSHGFESYRY